MKCSYKDNVTLSLEAIENDLISVCIPLNGKPPTFFTGYDIACDRLYSPPTKEDGIKIAQFMLNEWQQVLEYYQRKE